MINGKKGVAVVDMDDVLTYTTDLWFKYIYDKKEILEKYIDFNKIPSAYSYEIDPHFPLRRPCYNFAEWLLKKDLSPEDELIGRRFIMEAYLEQPDFYKDVKINEKIVETLTGLIKFKRMEVTGICVVTKTFSEFEEAKSDCIKKMFSTVIDKTSIRFVEILEKKSDAIKDIDCVAVIYEDELSNVYDYILNSSNAENSIIMIPLTGYNCNFDKRYEKLAKSKGIYLKYLR